MTSWYILRMVSIKNGTDLKIVWEASKAYFRGFVNKCMAKKNKEKNLNCREILTNLKEQEAKFQ